MPPSLLEKALGAIATLNSIEMVAAKDGDPAEQVALIRQLLEIERLPQHIKESPDDAKPEYADAGQPAAAAAPAHLFD